MNTYQQYSPYFSTLYDETNPIGNLGRGTHYSVLRCAEWHDVSLNKISKAQTHDLSVIWDEDHDERIIHVIEQLYFEGLLSPIQFIGERKANLTVILAAKFYCTESETTVNNYIKRIDEIADGLEFDSWNSEVGFFDRALGSPHQTDIKGIIADNEQRVQLYLRNIDSLWSLGTKEYNPSFNVT